MLGLWQRLREIPLAQLAALLAPTAEKGGLEKLDVIARRVEVFLRAAYHATFAVGRLVRNAKRLDIDSFDDAVRRIDDVCRAVVREVKAKLRGWWDLHDEIFVGPRGDQLREFAEAARKKAGSWRKLSEAIGISDKTLYNYKRSVRSVPVGKLKRLVEYLGRSPDEIDVAWIGKPTRGLIPIENPKFPIDFGSEGGVISISARFGDASIDKYLRYSYESTDRALAERVARALEEFIGGKFEVRQVGKGRWRVDSRVVGKILHYHLDLPAGKLVRHGDVGIPELVKTGREAFITHMRQIFIDEGTGPLKDRAIRYGRSIDVTDYSTKEQFEVLSVIKKGKRMSEGKFMEEVGDAYYKVKDVIHGHKPRSFVEEIELMEKYLGMELGDPALRDIRHTMDDGFTVHWEIEVRGEETLERIADVIGTPDGLRELIRKRFGV